MKKTFGKRFISGMTSAALAAEIAYSRTICKGFFAISDSIIRTVFPGGIACPAELFAVISRMTYISVSTVLKVYTVAVYRSMSHGTVPDLP